MCFSATASFAGGALLSAIGAAAIRKNKDPDRRLFAAVPMVFGLQQITEGFVWLALQSPGHELLLQVSAYIFLSLALVGWPMMIPLAVLLIEKSEKRRWALYGFLAVGVVVSLGYGLTMLMYPVTAKISYLHINYGLDFPLPLADAALYCYLIATLPPLFLSSERRMPLLGIVMVLSYAGTIFFYKEHLISVWCFFAALASVIILWIVIEGKVLAAVKPYR